MISWYVSYPYICVSLNVIAYYVASSGSEFTVNYFANSIITGFPTKVADIYIIDYVYKDAISFLMSLSITSQVVVSRQFWSNVKVVD